MPTQLNGLPAHVLLIHVVVILIPLGALFTVLSAVWPAAHRKLGFIAPLTCLIGLVFVPVTTHAGEWLRDKLSSGGQRSALIQNHAEIGDGFLVYALLLFVVSAAVWWLGRSYRWQVLPGRSADSSEPTASAPSAGSTLLAERTQAQKQSLPVWAGPVIAVVTVVVALLVTYELYRVGDSGAKAAWDYVKDLQSA